MMSLRSRLLLMLMSAALVTTLTATGVTYYWARSEIDQLFDYQLRQQALALRDKAFLLGGVDEAEPDPEQDVVIQVWDWRGARAYVSHQTRELPRTAELGFTTVRTRGEDWRVYSVALGPQVVEVGQPLSLRRKMATNAALRILLPTLAVLPLLALLIWWLVGRVLSPLDRLAHAIGGRDANALDPIATGGLPEEARPMISALNGLMQRLGQVLAERQRFTADAAHELRTPLTALRLQTQLLERATTDDDRLSAIAQLKAGIVRATHLVERLLALARVEPADGTVEPRASVLLNELAARAVAELEPAAADKEIALVLRATCPVFVAGFETGLASLVTNLLDNAVRYTPEGGRVELALALDADRAILTVTDTGPGIAAAERARVFDRFYRVPGTGVQGSGLGLAIVKRVADLHHASVALDAGPGGRGLVVRVSFPAG
jgi:two-component system OmpR family sensor kinase